MWCRARFGPGKNRNKNSTDATVGVGRCLHVPCNGMDFSPPSPYLGNWNWYLTVFLQACALVNTICVTICIHYGTGRHVYYLNDYQKVQANKFNWISQGFHVMSTNWGKVSVGLFLLRIVDRAKRKRYIFFGSMALLTVVNSVCVYTIYGQCTPTTALWNGTGPGKKGSCWHPNIQRDYAFFQGCMYNFFYIRNSSSIISYQTVRLTVIFMYLQPSPPHLI